MSGASTFSHNLPTRTRRPSGTGVQLTVIAVAAGIYRCRLPLAVSDTLGRCTWYEADLQVSDTLGRCTWYEANLARVSDTSFGLTNLRLSDTQTQKQPHAKRHRHDARRRVSLRRPPARPNGDGHRKMLRA